MQQNVGKHLIKQLTMRISISSSLTSDSSSLAVGVEILTYFHLPLHFCRASAVSPNSPALSGNLKVTFGSFGTPLEPISSGHHEFQPRESVISVGWEA